jgi:2-polyprenyl-6-methoxyphenol hydroxylase-like FAD-dependent oxidoreductase
MDKNSRILISGAGVAGLTCAIALGRQGFRPVVIEKAPTIRADGFIISLSHASYRYAQKLDLMDEIRARNPGILRSSYHDKRGNEMLVLDYARLFSGIDVVQVMRDDLEDILYSAAKNVAEIRLATSATHIDQDDDRARVTFNNEAEEEFDVVIGADGLHSNTRCLSFPPDDVAQHYLGLFSSAYRLPNEIGLKQRFENHMERSRYMCVYTTRDDDLACVFIWESNKSEAPPSELRREELQNQFLGAPKLVQDVLRGFPREKPVYMDPAIQIVMRRWSSQNVVLLGDAAHCLTLLSGQGASSAFWGACKLSEELIAKSKRDAFESYEKSFRPVIEEIQPATRLAAKWYVPRTSFRYVLRDAAMRYVPDAFFQRYFKNKYSKA